MTISQTVTIGDLISKYDDELADLRAAYTETIEFIESEWSPDAVERPMADDQEYSDEDLDHLAAMRTLAATYEESAKQIQRRTNALETLAEQLDGDTYDIRMLTGTELMDIERDLKLKAQRQDVDRDIVDHYRKGLVVDAATVDAPDGIPTDDDGSPLPSEAGNPLTLALYEMVETLNQAGATDFTAPGFDDVGPSGADLSDPRSTSDSAVMRSPEADATRET